MLFEEMTTGAIVAAKLFDTGSPLTSEQAEAVQDALSELNEKHDVSVAMFVPGDSVTDHADDPEMELYSPELYFGFSAVAATPDEAPCQVSLDQLETATNSLAAVPDEFWADLAEVDGLTGDLGGAAVYLMCYGPLPYAVLAYGVTHPSDRKDDVKYSFFSCQDMEQEWLPEGVDGVEIAGVEYDSVVQLDLSSEGLGELAKQVPELESPDLYLTVRYD